MTHETTIRRLWLAALVILGLVFAGYQQYRASVASRQEAALRAELVRARDAADAKLADAENGRTAPIEPGKGPGR